MLINDVAAKGFFRDSDPIGQVVGFNGRKRTIIGILRGVHFNGPEAVIPPEMYVPADQEPLHPDLPAIGFLVVRTDNSPMAVAEDLRTVLRSVLGTEPQAARLVDNAYRDLTAGRRFNAGVMGSFGIIALLVATLGIYGVMSFNVARQIRAIGLSMALGASRARVMRSVIFTVLRRVSVGLVIGLVAAATISKAFVSFVFGIRPIDPVTYLAVGTVVILVAVAAAMTPALRAGNLSPTEALRRE
jgi:ABC-type antimicrobial peptide transport system permease subunit